jgi:Spy/CpxP family protein refolding chaperone
MVEATWNGEPAQRLRWLVRGGFALAIAASAVLVIYTHQRISELEALLRRPETGIEAPGPEWFLAPILSELDLAPEQAAQIDSIWKSHRRDLSALRETFSATEAALVNVEESYPFNEAAAGELVNRKATAAAFLWGKRAYLVSLVLAVLDEEQRAEFRRLHKERGPAYGPDVQETR